MRRLTTDERELARQRRNKRSLQRYHERMQNPAFCEHEAARQRKLRVRKREAKEQQYSATDASWLRSLSLDELASLAFDPDKETAMKDRRQAHAIANEFRERMRRDLKLRFLPSAVLARYWASEHQSIEGPEAEDWRKRAEGERRKLAPIHSLGLPGTNRIGKRSIAAFGGENIEPGPPRQKNPSPKRRRQKQTRSAGFDVTVHRTEENLALCGRDLAKAVRVAPAAAVFPGRDPNRPARLAAALNAGKKVRWCWACVRCMRSRRAIAGESRGFYWPEIQAILRDWSADCEGRAFAVPAVPRTESAERTRYGPKHSPPQEPPQGKAEQSIDTESATARARRLSLLHRN